MKIKKCIIFLMFSLLLIGITGCNKGIESVAVANSTTLVVGQEDTLTLEVLTKNATITYTSGDTNIVTVDTEGNIKGISVGKTVINITVKSGDDEIFMTPEVIVVQG